MTYTTDSSHSPKNNTGDITPAIIRRVPNNPYHPNAVDIGWPTYYDAYVNKTNDQQSSVNVVDEEHNTSEIFTGANNALYLEHRPKLGTTISIIDDVTAVIDTGVTDYNHGVIFFSTLPTGDPITIQYLADPDKYFGEYLTQLQDSIHEVETWAGAGGTINEGVMNAEFWLDSTTGNIQARLPNHIHIRAIDRDIEIKSADNDTIGHNITIGNSEDHVYVDAETFNVLRGPNTGSNIVVNLTDETGDDIFAHGLVHLSPTGTSRNPAFSSNSVATGLTDPDRSTGLYDALRVYGSAYIAGDLTVLGNQNTLQLEITSQVAVINEDFRVVDNTFLGSDSNDFVIIAGDLSVTGGFTHHGVGGNDALFQRHINFGNNGVVSTIDGLDPSYIAIVQSYLRPAGSDWKGDCLNFGSIGITAETGMLTGGYAGSATQASSNANEIIDSDVTGGDFFTYADGTEGGLMYPQRFNDGTWFMKILEGPDIGDLVRIASFDSGTDTWTLSRDLNVVPPSGFSYEVYNPYFCDGDFITTPTSSSVQISSSATDRLVGNISGIVKLRASNDTIAGVSTAGTHYVYMTTDTTGALELPPEFAVNQLGTPSDTSILIGEVERDGSDFLSETCYRPNLKWDSTWRRVSTSPVGSQLDGGTTVTFNHNIGGLFRLQDYKVTILEAAGNGASPESPDLDTVQIRPIGVNAADYEINRITRTQLDLTVPNQNIWIRVMVTV